MESIFTRPFETSRKFGGERDYGILVDQRNQISHEFVYNDPNNPGRIETIKTPEKFTRSTVVVGDVQGFLEPFKDQLGMAGYIDGKGNWAGGQNRLVLMGDLLDKGTNGFSTIDFVLDLQQRAKMAGGEVVYIVGNHEQMWIDNDPDLDIDINGSLNNREAVAGCIEAWRDPAVASYKQARNEFVVTAGNKLRELVVDGRMRLMFTDGGTLFVHGGLTDEVCNKICSDLLHFQGNEPLNGEQLKKFVATCNNMYWHYIQKTRRLNAYFFRYDLFNILWRRFFEQRGLVDLKNVNGKAIEINQSEAKKIRLQIVGHTFQKPHYHISNSPSGKIIGTDIGLIEGRPPEILKISTDGKITRVEVKPDVNKKYLVERSMREFFEAKQKVLAVGPVFFEMTQNKANFREEKALQAVANLVLAMDDLFNAARRCVPANDIPEINKKSDNLWRVIKLLRHGKFNAVEAASLKKIFEFAQII